MNVEYPILPTYGDNPTEEDKENTIARYYGHQNRAGFFPVGMYNTWHGGIHIEDFGTNIRAIADGRIIAYRIPEDYFSEKDNEKNKFSNGFILIQHNFETPEKIKFQFYSLYIHLQPKTEMENSPNGRNIPDLYAKYTAKTRVNVRETGLKVREYCEDDTTKSREVRFIPKGGLLKKDNTTPPKGHWMENNTQYVFCNHNGEILCAYKGWLLDYDDEHYQINHLKAKDSNSFNSNAPKGTMLFDAIGGTYIGMECKDVTLEIETTKNKDWYKVKNTNNFVLVKDCTALTKKIKDDIKFDSVENVDVPIKAGQIIGVPSKYEANNLKFYTTVHLEVFSDDKNLANFINNSKDKDRTSYEIDKDKTIQVAKPCNFIKANTKVKIYQTNDNYTQIGFEDVFCEAVNGTDIVHKGKKQVYVNGKKVTKTAYAIKEDKFTEINNKLNNLLPNKDVLMYWSSKVSESIRKIGFGTAQSGKKYWVNSNEITGNENEWVSLVIDITAVYEKEPNDATQDTVVEKTTKIRKIASAKDSQDNEWWHVKAKKQQGWIKKSELTEKNPYQWGNYGWKILENIGDQYFYMFGKLVEKSEPHQFIQQIWEQADSDGDKQLTNAELQNAVRNKDTLNLISKLICKHPNEWNTWKNISKFESELKQLFQKGIDEAEGTDSDGNDLKQKLEQQRDQKVEMLKDKIEKLCFWDKIQTGDIIPVTTRRKEYIEANRKFTPKFRITEEQTPEEIELGKQFDELEAKRTPRSFPTTDNVYHFHPIALIEHLKMITAPTTPPWLEVALAEAKAAKFVKEFYKKEPSKKNIGHMVKKYHNHCGYYDNPKTKNKIEDERDSWCSSFVSWCLDQTNYKGAKSVASQSVLWKEEKLFKRIEEPEFGCIVLLTNYVKSSGRQTDNGHITFLYGKDSNGDLVCLGGNQGDRIKYSRYYTDKVCSTFLQYQEKEGKRVMVEQKFQGFFLPIKYPVGTSTELKTFNMTELNNKLAGKAVKSDGKNEKTT